MTDVTSTRRTGDDPYAVPPATVAGRPATAPGSAAAPPLYWRMLRLHHVRPSGWQRAMLVEGVIVVAVTLVLADVASAWTLVALPLAAAAVVKAHDVLAGSLPGRSRPVPLPPPTPSDYLPLGVLVVAALVLWLV